LGMKAGARLGEQLVVLGSQALVWPPVEGAGVNAWAVELVWGEALVLAWGEAEAVTLAAGEAVPAGRRARLAAGAGLSATGWLSVPHQGWAMASWTVP
jgi:hypothetical protein